MPRLFISGTAMGTSFSVQVVLNPNFSAREVGFLRERLSLKIGRIIEGVVNKMSFHSPDSEISRFNRFRGKEWFPVSRDTARVVSCALKISNLAGGAFDITLEPLVTLWGFGPNGKTGRIPPDREIAEVLERVGYRNLRARRFPPMLKKKIPESPATCRPSPRDSRWTGSQNTSNRPVIAIIWSKSAARSGAGERTISVKPGPSESKLPIRTEWVF